MLKKENKKEKIITKGTKKKLQQILLSISEVFQKKKI